MEANQGVRASKLHLREDNIFLGKTGKIRSIPTLNIRTDDVSASHAARVERIPEEKLYYLLSRGLDTKKATTLLLESMVGSLFFRLKNISETLYEDLKLDILTSLSHRNGE
jgi:Fe-S cluster assembly scaffold protein SufB